MAAETTDAALEEAVSALPRKKMSGKKLVLFIIIPILLIAGIGAGLHVSGVLGMLLHREADAAPAEIDRTKPGFFYDLPEMTVNLSTAERRQIFLQVKPTLELNAQTDVAAIERVMPRILDSFQVYLRELRVDDLRGSAGPHRLREELLRRVNVAVHPVEVREVLFGKFLLAN